jgi:hypothetical protein
MFEVQALWALRVIIGEVAVTSEDKMSENTKMWMKRLK